MRGILSDESDGEALHIWFSNDYYSHEEKGGEIVKTQDTRDAIGGGLLVAFGVGMAIWAYHSLPLGTPRRMGPGMYPLGVGVLIILIGSPMLASALLRRRTAPQKAIEIEINWRALIFISGALLAFGVLVAPFGLAPAIVALVFMSALAGSKHYWLSTIVVSLILPAIIYVIFTLGLGLPMATVSWPF